MTGRARRQQRKRARAEAERCAFDLYAFTGTFSNAGPLPPITLDTIAEACGRVRAARAACATFDPPRLLAPFVPAWTSYLIRSVIT